MGRGDGISSGRHCEERPDQMCRHPGRCARHDVGTRHPGKVDEPVEKVDARPAAVDEEPADGRPQGRRRVAPPPCDDLGTGRAMAAAERREERLGEERVRHGIGDAAVRKDRRHKAAGLLGGRGELRERLETERAQPALEGFADPALLGSDELHRRPELVGLVVPDAVVHEEQDTDPGILVDEVARAIGPLGNPRLADLEDQVVGPVNLAHQASAVE